MNKALWTVQILLALAFAAAGSMKLFTPTDVLMATEGMGWIQTTGIMAARLAGGAELLGAIGLILPSALRIAPKLTPLAAAGLVATMLGALATHAIRAEFAALPPVVVLGSLAVFVAWGRTFRMPIEARQAAGLRA